MCNSRSCAQSVATSDGAPFDDGRVAPSGSLCQAGGRRPTDDRPAGDERPGICIALREGVRRTSLLKGTPRQEHGCKPSKTTSPRGNHVSDPFDITVCEIKDPKEQWSRSRFRNQRDSVFYGHLVPSTQVGVFVEDACVQSASFTCIWRSR